MAEAVVGRILGSDVRTFSVGTKPAKVHPLAIEALKERGIDISDWRSKHIDEFSGDEFHLVVTLCDGAARECPSLHGQGRRVHAGLPDPAGAGGSMEERLSAFRAVRDQIEEWLVPIVKKELNLNN